MKWLIYIIFNHFTVKENDFYSVKKSIFERFLKVILIFDH